MHTINQYKSSSLYCLDLQKTLLFFCQQLANNNTHSTNIYTCENRHRLQFRSKFWVWANDWLRVLYAHHSRLIYFFFFSRRLLSQQINNFPPSISANYRSSPRTKAPSQPSNSPEHVMPHLLLLSKVVVDPPWTPPLNPKEPLPDTSH
jgi:hypothetical protein